mgnify:CR=1 FL=1
MKKLWFKNKRYGWGWSPASWEGWLVTAIFILLAVGVGLIYSPESGFFFVALTVLVGALIFICYATGETPEWRWGDKDKK